MVERLRGIFAFALYDARRGRLLLARDRYGVKPLFYAVHQGQWVFASEMKAILALPGFRPELDRQACYDFLGLGYIRELPRASWVTVDREGQRSRTYEDIEPRVEADRSLADAAGDAAERLLSAVSAQSVADVPV